MVDKSSINILLLDKTLLKPINWRRPVSGTPEFTSIFFMYILVYQNKLYSIGKV